MTPYHGFAGKLIRTASDPASPASPVSPFSPESATARDASISLFQDVVANSKVRLNGRLEAELPRLLWLASLGITLYWVHDRSEGQTRTRLLIDRATPVIGRLVELSRLPLLRPITNEVLALVGALRQPQPTTRGSRSDR
jgi:hypothetical protein